MARSDSAYICTICNRPVDLRQDRYADEDGHIVHEQCYIARLLSLGQDPPDPHHTE
jgi:hypothetical protein